MPKSVPPIMPSAVLSKQCEADPRRRFLNPMFRNIEIHLKRAKGTMVTAPRTIEQERNTPALAKMKAPFDRQAILSVVHNKAKIVGNPLKVITRGQTNEAIGQLAKTSHKKSDIQSYICSTKKDGRMWETHNALSEIRQRGNTPPGVGHPGENILCRCVTVPILPKLGRKRVEETPPAPSQ